MQVCQRCLYINPVKERASKREREGNSESTRVTEGHMPGNEMCNYWMQEGHMYGKKGKFRIHRCCQFHQSLETKKEK